MYAHVYNKGVDLCESSKLNQMILDNLESMQSLILRTVLNHKIQINKTPSAAGLPV